MFVVGYKQWIVVVKTTKFQGQNAQKSVAYESMEIIKLHQKLHVFLKIEVIYVYGGF